MLKTGIKALTFKALDQEGVEHRLADHEEQIGSLIFLS